MMARPALFQEATHVGVGHAPLGWSRHGPSIAGSASDEQAQGRELIRLDGVTKRFADLVAVDSLSSASPKVKSSPSSDQAAAARPQPFASWPGSRSLTRARLAGRRVAGGGDWRPPEKRRFYRLPGQCSVPAPGRNG